MADDRILVFATRNRGKIAELTALVAPLGVTVKAAADLPGVPEVEEDGETFEANAVKKAREVAAACGLPALADDSGLEVDALDGAPGVHSARYSGEGATDARNNKKLVAALQGVATEQRTAHFTCAMAFVDPKSEGDAALHVSHGRCDGVILDAPRGEGGFGYDPLFYVAEHEATFAELPRDVKNTMSHRARALAGMRTHLERYFGSGG